MNTSTPKFKTWITADLHLGHANIMKFNPATRQHLDVIDMNESIVRQWNEDVMQYDLVYILGDVAFCNAQKAVEYLNRMNGRKILVSGNHDVKLLKDSAFRDCFEAIHQYLEIDFVAQDTKTKVVMFHFPVLEWNQCHRGSVHFFGHQHGNGTVSKNRSMDVGMDATGKVVSEMGTLVSTMLMNPMQGHH